MSQAHEQLDTQVDEQPREESSLDDIAGLLNDKEGTEEVEATQDESQEGDDATEPEDEGEQETAQKPSEDDWKAKKVKVTVQGEEQEITLEEATKGYMRDQDYRRKTAEVAQSTKAVEQQRQWLEGELAKQVNQLNALGFALQQELIGDESQIASLLDSDPHAYLKAKQVIEAKTKRLAQVMAAQQEVQQMQAFQQHEALKKATEDGMKVLMDRIPEWRDEGKRGNEQREIAGMLLDCGYSREEVSMLTDPRAVELAREALLWRKSQAARATQGQKVAQTPPKPIKPGSANPPDKSAAVRTAEDNYRRNSGSLDSLAALAHARGI